MTTAELMKRIEKKEDQINRKFKTMEKKKEQILKKREKVRQIEDEGERRWLQYDIEHLEDDLRRLDREIQECSKTLEKYEMQLEKEEDMKINKIELVKEGEYWTLYVDGVQCVSGYFSDMIEVLTECKKAGDALKDATKLDRRQAVLEGHAMTKYYVEVRENGETLETVYSKEVADEIVRLYEEQDRNDGTFTPEFYEIVERTVPKDGTSEAEKNVHDTEVLRHVTELMTGRNK